MLKEKKHTVIYIDIYIFLLFFITARSPVFNAMFEHEMEERKQV